MNKEVSKKEDKVVISTVLKLLEKWKLSDIEKRNILGGNEDNIVNTLSPEHEIRIALILDIHAQLRQLFSNPSNYYGYMKMVNHNAPFQGRRPIDIANEGLDELQYVRDAIRQMRSL